MRIQTCIHVMVSESCGICVALSLQLHAFCLLRNTTLSGRLLRPEAAGKAAHPGSGNASPGRATIKVNHYMTNRVQEKLLSGGTPFWCCRMPALPPASS